MPRRNLFWLVTVCLVSLLCYHNVEHDTYGRILINAMDKVESDFVTEIGREELFEGAMDGMMKRLNDRHSVFISAQRLEKFNEQINQQFGGVGMEVRYDPVTQRPYVASPLYGSPAYNAGIRAGDQIVRIDGRSTQGISLTEATDLMRGKPGTDVSIGVLHRGQEDEVQVTIQRARIQVDTVRGDTRQEDGSWNFRLEQHPQIAYVRITAFAGETTGQLRKAIEEATAQGARGLILDLRGNPGGLLESAREICDLFIESGVIVTKRHRDLEEAYEATAGDTYTRIPLAVLVDGDSASASEIVAACLQDHGRAAIAGERTFGKGSVQEVYDLEGQRGAIKLTIASFWRPSEKNIDRKKDSTEDDEWGVMPNDGYSVKLETEERARLGLWRLRRDAYTPADSPQQNEDDELKDFVDRQLAKAVEYIEEKIDGR